jgi:membrane protease YdiL (CAAX protease family)
LSGAALRREGKYRFATRHASTGSLLTAPLDPEFLLRWTTWIELAYTGAIVALVLGERGVAYEPFKARDGAFAGVLSYSAGVGEEALFRGRLMPLSHQSMRERFWLANGIQAVIFGGLHIPDAKGYAAVIAAWAFYEGWLTRRSGWSVRESIFHHFWYDVLIVTATFLVDEHAPGLVIAFPTVRF